MSKYCEICGAEIPDGALFCPKCGTSAQNTVPGNVWGVTGAGGDYSSPRAKKKCFLLIGAAAAVAIVLFFLLVNFAGGTKTFNLEDYLDEPVFSGYDGYGSAYVSFDGDKLLEDCSSQIMKKIKRMDDTQMSETVGMTSEDIEILELMLGEDLKASDIFGPNNLVLVNGYPETGLSNGDEFTIEFTYDAEELEKVGLRFTGETKTYTVSGLEEPETVDAFADVSISFSGYAPNGCAEILNNSSGTFEYAQYTAEPSTGLSNGDVVTVTLDDSIIDVLAENGEVPESLTKEYTVEGLLSYITSIDQISEDVSEKIVSEGYDNRLALYAGKNVTITSFDLLGYYLLTKKDGSGENILYAVYKVGAEKNNFAASYYWWMEYSDVVTNAEGEISMDYTNFLTPSTLEMFTETDSNGKEYYFLGCWKNLDSLYADTVNSYVDEYVAESSVSE